MVSILIGNPSQIIYTITNKTIHTVVIVYMSNRSFLDIKNRPRSVLQSSVFSLSLNLACTRVYTKLKQSNSWTDLCKYIASIWPLCRLYTIWVFVAMIYGAVYKLRRRGPVLRGQQNVKDTLYVHVNENENKNLSMRDGRGSKIFKILLT